MKEVYLFKCNSSTDEASLSKGIATLFKKINATDVVKKGDLTALKVHFGEDDNITFIPASWIKLVVDQVKKCSAHPFLSDTNVLYKSRRSNAVEHLELAYQNGFTFEAVGAPIIIADGLLGKNETSIEINCPLNKEAAIASDLVNANSIVFCTHVTGHVFSELAATLKNMGMGMAARKSKLIQHSKSPVSVSKRCVACKKCINHCPVSAITLKDNKASIGPNCISCGECMAVCKFNAIHFKWDSTVSRLQNQMAEHAYAAHIANPNMIFLAFLINITSLCDCVLENQEVIHPDVGILISRDPVAIDQATLDLLNQFDIDKNVVTDQLEYAKNLGLGERKYSLTTI